MASFICPDRCWDAVAVKNSGGGVAVRLLPTSYSSSVVPLLLGRRLFERSQHRGAFATGTVHSTPPRIRLPADSLSCSTSLLTPRCVYSASGVHTTKGTLSLPAFTRARAPSSSLSAQLYSTFTRHCPHVVRLLAAFTAQRGIRYWQRSLAHEFAREIIRFSELYSVHALTSPKSSVVSLLRRLPFERLQHKGAFATRCVHSATNSPTAS